MDSWEKFDDPELPSKENFYSTLTGEHISDEDYEHAQKVWNAFDMSFLQEYHDLYLKTDVLLLADVFENFRKTSYFHYKLDSAHYLSAPGLSWDAMLLATNQQLDLLSDPAIFKMMENGMRGGVCMITKRQAKANNKYMKEKYDPSKPSNFIIYLDANNLYGWAMSQRMPSGGFRWESDLSRFTADYIKKLDEDEMQGFVLEVDLEYPANLHDDHNDYPLAVERFDIKVENLSEEQRRIIRAYGKKEGGSTKLVPNLFNKEHYVVHYLLLKFYLEQGLVLKKVHRVVSFLQTTWLKDYIDLNSKLRAEAKNTFEKDFFKLMNNAVYGKTCENLRKHMDVRITTKESQLKKLIEKPQFISAKIISEEMAAVHLQKRQVLINKYAFSLFVINRLNYKQVYICRPTYVGFAVLELSKLLMYKFHYEYVKEKFKGRAQLLFTDTDSLVYDIQSEDLYAELFEDRGKFDFSDYPTTSQFHCADNKKKIGKMKDETAGEPIVEFVGLRPKMYSFITCDHEHHRAKGIQKAVVERKLRHDHYKAQLETPQSNKLINTRIASDHHRVYTVQCKKDGLCSFDDKRWLNDDGITTRAHGHYTLRQEVVDLQLPEEEVEPTEEDEVERLIALNEDWLDDELRELLRS